MTRNMLALIVVSALAASSAAQHHHEAPAKDVPAEMALGEISFPATGSAAAQPHFLRGVLLLHSFEYGPAETAFAEARKIDPAFAMAYWGGAMTHNHPIWGEQDRPAALSILRALPASAAAALTDREKAYLAAVEVLYGDGEKKARDAAYSAAMRELSERHPEDLDARAFYALSLICLTVDARDLDNYMRAAAVA